MLTGHNKAADKVVLNSEGWKSAVGSAICAANSEKFYALFTPEQQKYILERLDKPVWQSQRKAVHKA